MTARHAYQWLVFSTGLAAHAFSRLVEEDTIADRPDNWQLDRKDADGNRSDGMFEAWMRLADEPSLHNLKNIPREWLEIVHPKTATRIISRVTMVFAGIGVAIGALIVWLA